MVLGSIVNWVVFRSLDLTVSTIWWVTTTTTSGLYNAGHYIIYRQSPYNNVNKEMLELMPISLLKEQNELLKEQNSILRFKLKESFI